MHKHPIRWLAILLCAVYVIANIAFLFIPHTHGCIDTDCVLCSLMEASRRMLTVVLPVTIGPVICLSRIFTRLGTYLTSGRDQTLVGLMVKLSD